MPGVQTQAALDRRGLSFDFAPARAAAPTRARLPHLRALDGLRGLAVVGVVLYHLASTEGGSATVGPTWMKGGFLGVSLFFTLSGFLITSLLLFEDEQQSSIDFGSFWGRRFRRLLPAAWAGVALAITYTLVAGDADQLRRLPSDVIAALGEVANWQFIFANDTYTAGYQAPSPLLHYWSLAIEEQFYLLFPLLVAGLARRRAPLRTWRTVVWALLGGTVAFTFLLYDASNTNRTYFATVTRTGEILAGVALALALRRWWVRTPDQRAGWWLGRGGRGRALLRTGLPVLALVVVLGLWWRADVGDQWLYRGGFYAVAALSCLLVVGVLTDGPVAWLMSQRPLVAMGLISYGVYVYHWPLFLWIDTAHTGLAGLPLAAARVSATLAVASLSYRYFERPIRHGSFRLTVRLLWVPASVATVAIVLASVAVVAGRQADSRAVASARDAARSAPLITQPPVTAVGEQASGPQVKPPPKKVLLLGDSLVHQAMPIISSMFSDQGTETRAIGGPSQTLLRHQAAWLGELQNALDSFRPDVVVLESCCGHNDAKDPYIQNGKPLALDSEELWQVFDHTAEQAVLLSERYAPAVLWTLVPPARTNGFYGPIEQRITRANAIAMDLSRRHPKLGLVDWRVIAGKNGEYVDSLPDVTGRMVPVRAADGFHFAPAGMAILAGITRDAVDATWQRAGDQPTSVQRRPGT